MRLGLGTYVPESKSSNHLCWQVPYVLILSPRLTAEYITVLLTH